MILASFIIEGNPVAKGRPRAAVRGGHARLYTPSKTRSFEQTVRDAAKSDIDPYKGPVELEAHFTLPIAKSWCKMDRALALEGKILPQGKPDLDNFVKAIADGLNGTIFADDGQIVSLRTTKRYGAEPGVAVTVRTM